MSHIQEKSNAEDNVSALRGTQTNEIEKKVLPKIRLNFKKSLLQDDLLYGTASFSDHLYGPSPILSLMAGSGSGSGSSSGSTSGSVPDDDNGDPDMPK